ncbi:MAG TPA: ferrochelatase [Rhodocyclaceae bacterium]|nr:ferrochelatase [Rhodocyclaceae bacterium]
MPRYHPEPAHLHGSPARTGILYVNLGTPDAPTAPALRRYLREFLWDPRVVEIPRPLWWLILNGIILNTRPAKSAAKYATVWTPDGSPLAAHTAKQAKLLRGWLGAAGHPDVEVAWAMRYGNPSIASRLDELKAAGCTRILILPAYPQYAAATTASVVDMVATWAQRTRNLPELRFVRNYHDHTGYIAALAASVREHWMKNGPLQGDDKLVMSFHGLPRFSLDKGDPYFCKCHKTGRLLAEALGLAHEQYEITFQSRFGRAEWLQPYTQPTLEALARAGVRRVDVVCPGFVADCLETLEEIGMECKQAFLTSGKQSGGQTFHYIPCLNERADAIAALGEIARTHLGHWLSLPTHADPACAARAQALGAQN